MLIRFLRFLFLLTAMAGAQPAVAAAPVVLDLGHQLDPGGRGWLERIVNRFNSGQREVEVRLTDESGVPARPALALLDRAAANGLGGERAFRPLYRVMSETGMKLPPLSPEVAAAVADAKGRPLALPIAQSTPVLFYNKALFRAARLDPEAPPQTWFEVQQAADKLFDAGSRCPFTASQPAVTLVEQTSLSQGEPLSARGQQAAVNGLIQVRHVALMASWVRSRFFIPYGRGNEADRHFVDGTCGMIATGSHLFPSFRQAGIDVGVARFPGAEAATLPRHTVPTGLALWIGEGRKRQEYQAAARFVGFLMGPEVQTELIRDGGFLPFAAAGRAALSGALAVDAAPQQEIALAQIKGARDASLLGSSSLIRDVLDEELEAVWADSKPAKAALDEAAVRIGGESRRPPPGAR